MSARARVKNTKHKQSKIEKCNFSEGCICILQILVLSTQEESVVKHVLEDGLRIEADAEPVIFPLLPLQQQPSKAH